MTSRASKGEDPAEAAILELAGARGAGKTICPSEAARALAGDDPAFQRHMPAVRRAAVRLATEGRLVITRKGKAVDPQDFKGVYRLGLPAEE